MSLRAALPIPVRSPPPLGLQVANCKRGAHATRRSTLD